MLIGGIASAGAQADSTAIDDFVTRHYELILGRQLEAEGFAYWVGGRSPRVSSSRATHNLFVSPLPRRLV